MIKKLAFALPLLVPCALYLFAADFWESKPFTEWNDKEVQKLLEDSPWADKISVRTGQKGVVANDDAKGPIMGELEAPVRLIWVSALPVKQALAKRRFGAEAGTSAEAKDLIDRDEPYYALWVQGLPGVARAAAADTEKVIEETMLRVKGKPDVKPVSIQMPTPAGRGAPKGRGRAGMPVVQFATAAYQRGGRGGGGFGGPPPGGGGGGRGFGTFDLYFIFPRDANYTAADKEVEFVTKLDRINIKRKFKLQDMVFMGKLEM